MAKASRASRVALCWVERAAKRGRRLRCEGVAAKESIGPKQESEALEQARGQRWEQIVLNVQIGQVDHPFQRVGIDGSHHVVRCVAANEKVRRKKNSEMASS